MPTANRRSCVALAIRCFQTQDYQNKELVILDDGAESIADLIPPDPQIRYRRVPRFATLGDKRNECVIASRGDLIMHWDDDDWMAPHRISYQVRALLRERAEVCGLQRMLFCKQDTGEVWLYEYPDNQRPWLAGGSLLYTRDFWRRSPFPSIQVASDTRFMWDRQIDRQVVLPDYTFYVAMIHDGNTSPKNCAGSYWTRWSGDLRQIMGSDVDSYIPEKPDRRSKPVPVSGDSVIAMNKPAPTYSIIMTVHNALEMVRMSTLRTLRHIALRDARLIVVDNASCDGTKQWLDLLAKRGDIDLSRSQTNVGHGPGIELARREIRSPFIVTLDSDAFPLSDDWLPRLRGKLSDRVRVVGIRHHRDYIHPSCLMIARKTLEEFNLSFLNEKDQPSQFDVAERISCEVKRRGYEIAGLERTGSLRRGSVSEPVYLGSEYENLVYHQWYTTRAAMSQGTQVDDVPADAIDASLQEVFAQYEAEPRELTVVMGVRGAAGEPERVRNAEVCLQVLNLQDLGRWRYRLIVVEQDHQPQLERVLGPLADKYIFAYNPGPYNRGWAFNIGASLPSASTGALCLIDADLLVPPDFFRRGLESLKAGRRAVLPYREILYLDSASTERAIAEPTRAFSVTDYGGRVFDTSQGGCIFVDASLYHDVGGHDERFWGWGREDREFCDRLARAAQIERLPGRLLHLYHPRPEEEGRCATANQRLYEEISLSGALPTPRAIGDPNLCSSESAAVSAHCPRDWENWDKWDGARIERIVRDEKGFGDASTRRALAEILVRLGSSLLDVGCGPGALWLHLEPYKPRFSWAGVDVTERMVAVARRLFPSVEVRKADAGCLPFDDSSFDVVLMHHVLEHLPPWLMERALTEAARVARKAVVLDFYVPPVNHGVRRTIRVGENFLETRWTVADLEAPIRKAGWSASERSSLPGGSDVIWILKPLEHTGAPEQEAASSEDLKISIVMPTYRRSHTIYRTVETIQAQTHQNWELIVVQNDGEAEYKFNDPRIKVYQHTDQTSASFARNQGLQYVTGDLVCFFDDDDDMFPGYLQRFAETFQKNPKAKMVRCGMVVSGGRTNFSYATPECCLLKESALAKWSARSSHDQLYFTAIASANGWSEANGDIVVIREALCRANCDPRGGLRSGRL
jgi:glycosyltransferase involved in cell wall biosynthesis